MEMNRNKAMKLRVDVLEVFGMFGAVLVFFYTKKGFLPPLFAVVVLGYFR